MEITAQSAENFSIEIRHDWTLAEISDLHSLPLPELLFRAQTIHRATHAPDKVQTCKLLSIKTGGCPEDCAYCPQSAHYEAGVDGQELMKSADVIVARAARNKKALRDFAWELRGAKVPTGMNLNLCWKW